MARASAAREQAGTVTGYALDEEGANLTAAVSLLEDMQVSFAQCEVTKLSSERFLELLADLRPAI